MSTEQKRSIYAEGMSVSEWADAVRSFDASHPGYHLTQVYQDAVVARNKPLGWLHRDGTFRDRGNLGLEAWREVLDGCRFKTIAEATFRLLLYTNPRQALAAFFAATGGEYVGTCENCNGGGSVTLVPRLATSEQLNARSYSYLPDISPCPTCHGTGGPPSPDDLGEVSDWFGERGCEMEASVLRGMAK